MIENILCWVKIRTVWKIYANGSYMQFLKIYDNWRYIWCFQKYYLIKKYLWHGSNFMLFWKILVNSKTHRHLKELRESKIFMVFARIYANWKNICCFYILNNASNMTSPTTYYPDIAYSKHVVCRHMFGNIFIVFNVKSTCGEV